MRIGKERRRGKGRGEERREMGSLEGEKEGGRLKRLCTFRVQSRDT